MKGASKQEEASGIVWENFLEDPIMSRISSHVYCSHRTNFSKEWSRGTLKNHYNCLYYIESGKATITTSNEIIQLKEGYSYLLPNHISFAHECQSEITIHWCHFQMLLNNTNDIFQHITIPIELSPKNKSEYVNAFINLEALMKKKLKGDTLLRSSYLLQLVHPYLNNYTPSTSDLENLNRFMPILQYIDEHLAEPIRIETLSKMIGLHPEYFSRFFRKNFKKSPKQYIVHRRVQNAQKLLSYGNDQIQEISDQCGFSDPYHFAKSFKKSVGFTPTAFRKMAHSQHG